MIAMFTDYILTAVQKAGGVRKLKRGQRRHDTLLEAQVVARKLSLNNEFSHVTVTVRHQEHLCSWSHGKKS